MKITVEQRLEFLKVLTRLMTDGIRSGLWARWKKTMGDIVSALFDNQGGDYGREKWPPISDTMIGKIRRGSLGGVFGRYEAGSKPLQASGEYRKSFGVISETPSTLVYGTKHPLGDRIPYCGWNRTGAGYVPRYALPDTLSEAFGNVRSGIDRANIESMLLMAREGAGF